MPGIIKVVLLGTALTVGGHAFVAHGKVLSAASTDGTTLLWALGFASPMLLIAAAWWAFEWWNGRRQGVVILKLACFMSAAPVAFAVLHAAEGVIDRAQADAVRASGLDVLVRQYVALPRTADPFRGADGGTPVIAGKLVVIDAVRGSVSDIQFRLPRDLAPAVPVEVGTVAHVEWVGTPNDPYRRTCRVRLIDLGTGVVTSNRALFRPSDRDADVLSFLTACARVR